MESFLKRKKRKLSPPPPAPSSQDEEESTDVKLAMLSSLHPTIEQEVLLDVLLAYDGSVSQASSAFQTRHLAKKARGHLGAQTSLKSYAIASTSDERASPTKKKPVAKKGTTIHLFDPEDIAEHTPCTIIHNFLPQDEANDLLKELLEESKSFEKITFKLFENVVASPHTSSFYVEGYDEIQQQKTDYLYNGATLTVSLIAPPLKFSYMEGEDMRVNGPPFHHVKL
jgi:hypothetical protein